MNPISSSAKAHTQLPAVANQAPPGSNQAAAMGMDVALTAASPAVPVIRADAEKTPNNSFAGLLGTPPERTGQRAFPKERHQIALDLAEAMIEAGIRTPEGMVEFLDRKFHLKARPFSQSLWSLFAFTEPSLASVPDWEGIYATRDAVERAVNFSDLFDGFARAEYADLFETSPPRTAPTVILAKDLVSDLSLDDASLALTAENTCSEDDSEENDQENEDEEDEEADDGEPDEAVALWAADISEELAAITNLLKKMELRPSLTPDHFDAIRAMSTDLAGFRDGERPTSMWQLGLTLSQGMDDGSSRGTRTYEITVDENGFGARCCGTEYERGVGSDSWTGSTFCYACGSDSEVQGDLCHFSTEFEDAVRNAEYLLSISLNDESIGEIPREKSGDSTGERLAKTALRQVIIGLQELMDTLSGEDSGLITTWDEICAQQQIEESVCWDAYEATIRALIKGSVRKMPREKLVKVWLLTNEGENWEIYRESDDEKPCPNESDVVDFLYGRLLSVASDYLNHRIIAFRDHS